MLIALSIPVLTALGEGSGSPGGFQQDHLGGNGG